MWPRSAETLYGGLEPPASNQNDLNFEFYYIRMLERITACLHARLGVTLPSEVQFVPAILLFNQCDDPLWCDLGRGYGTGQTKAAIKALETAQELLRSDGAGEHLNLTRAYEACLSLPRPASIYLDRAYELGHDSFSQVIGHLIDIYSIQLDEARRWGGNAHAKRLAIRLRAITEFYTDYPVYAGKSSQTPVGEYVECLDELYRVIGIKAHFYRFAKPNYGRPLEQEELANSFEFLRSCSGLEG